LNQYEAMFLFDPTFAASFDACESEVKRLMERAEAELLFCRKWEERRLAHRIKGRKRGVYALVYFKAPPDKIKPLERDAQISENILRLLVVRADYATPEMMEMALRQREATATDEGGAPPSKSRAPDSAKEADKPGVAAPEAKTRAAAAPEAASAVAAADSTEPVAADGSADEAPETAREETD
jgi:small subunit ribosomal protein S6